MRMFPLKLQVKQNNLRHLEKVGVDKYNIVLAVAYACMKICLLLVSVGESPHSACAL